MTGPISQITEPEVGRAIKNGKSPGLDDIPAEFWKMKELHPTSTTWLTSFLNLIVDTGKVPSSWSSRITIPIFKNKGDPAVCSNYWLIWLLSHTMKILERIIDKRLCSIITLSTNHRGFVKGCGTIDAIHAARLLLEKHCESRKPLHIAFLDLEKAFDHVPHQLIWYTLRERQVPEQLISWIKMLYTNTSSHVHCPASTSDNFPICVGVHQGSALSPFLFVVVMDTITHDLQQSIPWTLLYADDVMRANTTRGSLQEQVLLWKSYLSQWPAPELTQNQIFRNQPNHVHHWSGWKQTQ